MFPSSTTFSPPVLHVLLQLQRAVTRVVAAGRMFSHTPHPLESMFSSTTRSPPVLHVLLQYYMFSSSTTLLHVPFEYYMFPSSNTCSPALHVPLQYYMFSSSTTRSPPVLHVLLQYYMFSSSTACSPPVLHLQRAVTRVVAAGRLFSHSPHPLESMVDGVVVSTVPESRFKDVLDQITPIFLKEEPLSQCFPPCTSGRREREFREYATKQLRSGLCIMALDVLQSRVVGSCLNRVLTRDEVMNDPEQTQDSPSQDNGEARPDGTTWHRALLPARIVRLEEDDPLNSSVVTMLTAVHRKIDLFTMFNVDRVLELGLVSVESSHAGRAVELNTTSALANYATEAGLATKMLKASMCVGARRGLLIAKGDCTGPVSQKACQKAGMVPIYKLPYEEYKVDNQVVFKGINSALVVVIAKIQTQEPFVQPLDLPASRL
uniref:Uncharacterized protein n=1 Tax=Timema shepardi TaxID=629360 RepID=A0A7R9G6R9_TIMSH|nr:unnamed protein product [Timema shepardi]